MERNDLIVFFSLQQRYTKSGLRSWVGKSETEGWKMGLLVGGSSQIVTFTTFVNVVKVRYWVIWVKSFGSVLGRGC